jgi:hypothetical protein
LKYFSIILIIICWRIFLPTYTCKANEYKPKAYFKSNTTKIGKTIDYVLTFEHPSDWQVFFPDSFYNYQPLELIEKKSYNTVSNAGISNDSAVYRFVIFNLDTQVIYTLPVFILNSIGDTTKLFPNPDTLLINHLVKGDQATISLKPITELHTINESFNYPYFLFFGLGSILLLVFLVFLLRKNIIWRYKLWVLSRGHLAYLRSIEKYEKEIEKKFDTLTLEAIIADWKAYLSRLENSPINTYTTKEIVALFQNEELGNTLQELDRIIYGSTDMDILQIQLAVLKKFATQRFQRRRKELRYV